MGEAKDSWKKKLEEARLRDDVDFDTLSSVPLAPLYTNEDIKDLDHDEDLGYPGEYPFTRGVYPSMYRGRLYTFRQFSGFGTAEETNARYKFLIEQGNAGLSVAFDMPTLMGRDSDDPMSEGEVGRCGVAVDTVTDMEILFKDIPLDQTTTSMTISGPAPMIFAMWLVVAERQGVAWADLDGTLQTDILKEYIAQKEWIYPPAPHLRLTADLMKFCRDEVPNYHPLSISGYHIREAGSTAVQELAFTLASGFAHVELGMRNGMTADEVAGSLSFFFNSHIDFFEEIAKYRAARRIWSRWMKERYGCETDRAMMMRFHTQTAGVSLTAQQPYNNVVRTALEALAAVLGGTQSLHTNSLDEVLALPTEEASEIALRTQQIIAYETGAANVIDPLGGSYFVESLTNQSEEAAEAYFSKIDELGDGSILDGMLRGIEEGYFQGEIADAAYTYQQEEDRKERITVGVNDYLTGDILDIPLLRVDAEGERRHVRQLDELRRRRDNREVTEKLRALEQAARGSENLMPPLLEAVKAYATLGEMMGVFREVFGEYQPSWGF